MRIAISAVVLSPFLCPFCFFNHPLSLCRLRALSGGGGSGSGGGGSGCMVASPPLSPALPKYKLADYRYGREEMLALYVKDNKIPIDLHDKEFLPILQEEPLPPLALVSFTEEEQRNFSMSVNSAAVLRLTGRGGGPIAGAPRGRSTSRGRGRGRGDGGFYQRSFDDVEGFGRGGREMHRSQSWEERGDRRFEKPGRKEPVRGNYEDGGTGLPRKHEFTRAESENWRSSRDDQNGEDDEGGWRLAGSRRDGDRWCPPSPDGPRSAGWREHPDQRRRFPFDAREDERGYRRPRSGSGSLEDERDSLPEWCLEDADEEAGTFDSSGAFLSLKKASKEPILEEAELEFKPLEECEEGLEEEDSHSRETKEMETEAKREAERKEVSAPSPAIQLPQQKPMEIPVAMNNPLSFSTSMLAPIGRPTAVPHDTDEDEGLKHFEREAEKMVAYLQDGVVDDDRLTAKTSEKPKPAGLPLTHEAALKWFYKDPQGEIQGPFSNQEMAEWFQAGYFTMSLLVKRGCDEVFQPLGEIMKIWGRVPFTPGPAPPLITTTHNISLLPPVTRSLSVPDSGSVWEMQNSSSQASSWDSSSVWDLPIDSVAQAPTIEQMQQFEKSKSAKLDMERREAEMRAKREEEERKRLEEALRARQEEERKRLEEEELARKKQVEARRGTIRGKAEGRGGEEETGRLPSQTGEKQEELEVLRRREEEKRAEEEAAAAAAAALAQQQEEEQKRREQEAQRQQEQQRQRQQQQEALRRLQQQQQQQQQLAQMKVKLSIDFMHTNSCHPFLSPPPQHRRQQQELLKLQQQQALQLAQQPQAKLSGWGSVAKQPAATKSLLEIQREEAQQMKQRKDHQPPQQHPTITNQIRSQTRTPSLSNSVWGSVNTSTNWSDSSSIWGDTHNSNMGFWDEAVKEAVQPPPQPKKGSTQKNNKGNANLSNSVSGRVNKKVEEEEKLLKLFQGVSKSHQDTFMQWCEQTLHTLNTANNLDVPTFASFLKEVDSPYEVHDYVRAYLGDTPEAKDFAKQFLERRAKQNANQQKQAPQNQQQALKQQQDSVWGGTGSSSLYQSNHTSGQQQQRFETVTSGKKKKKQKMVRADPSLLGFSVNASSERLNMGEIETLEDF
uniref:GRB10 interacting GYF protein 2 n=1 Tax=Sparus aurata TaxID=8175 RepID=A0A671Z0A0_SPAAU